MSVLSLRLPDSLHLAARELAEEEHVSINHPVTLALAEKISAPLGAKNPSGRLRRSSRRGNSVFTLPQNIAEFWNVCTRPADKNGLGLSPEETERRLTVLDTILTMLHDSPVVYHHWRKLIVRHAVKGIQVHDARIAAAMQVHSIARLVTYNPRDFNRYEGITTISPADVR